MRLTNSTYNSFNDLSSVFGVIQVCVNQQFVYVCSDGWDDREAEVACRTYSYSYRPPYYGEIVLNMYTEKLSFFWFQFQYQQHLTLRIRVLVHFTIMQCAMEEKKPLVHANFPVLMLWPVVLQLLLSTVLNVSHSVDILSCSY